MKEIGRNDAGQKPGGGPEGPTPQRLAVLPLNFRVCRLVPAKLSFFEPTRSKKRS